MTAKHTPGPRDPLATTQAEKLSVMIQSLLGACKESEVQMDQAAALLADFDDEWAREKSEQLATAAMHCRAAIAKAKGKA